MATRTKQGGRPDAARVTPIHAADLPRGPFVLVLADSDDDKNPVKIPISAKDSKALRQCMERHNLTLHDALKTAARAL